MSYIRNRPEALLTAAEATSRFDSSRRRMLEAWTLWLTDAEPPAATVESEIEGTASAMRQIAQTVAP